MSNVEQGRRYTMTPEGVGTMVEGRLAVLEERAKLGVLNIYVPMGRWKPNRLATEADHAPPFIDITELLRVIDWEKQKNDSDPEWVLGHFCDCLDGDGEMVRWEYVEGEMVTTSCHFMKYNDEAGLRLRVEREGNGSRGVWYYY